MKNEKNKFKRLFIAIDIPMSIKEIIFQTNYNLFSDIDKVKIIKPENIHLTLKFLGSQNIDNIDRLKDILKTTMESFSKFQMMISNEIGTFPSINKARVAFVKVGKGAENILEIYDKIENNLKILKIDREIKKFEPHITIARFKNGVDISNKLNSCVARHTYDIGCNKISLFESILNIKGPTYIILDEFILK